jgi:hypothetical protein
LSITARRATKFSKLRPYKTTVVYILKEDVPVARINFCNCFLRSVNGGVVDPHVVFSFLMRARFNYVER